MNFDQSLSWVDIVDRLVAKTGMLVEVMRGAAINMTDQCFC